VGGIRNPFSAPLNVLDFLGDLRHIARAASQLQCRPESLASRIRASLLVGGSMRWHCAQTLY
jgi:hypothetical protein